MSVDITVFVERRNKKTGKWESLSLYAKNNDGKFEPCTIYDGRNSELFSLLAGVGIPLMFPVKDIGCLVVPRGMPDDVSDEVKKAYGDGEYYFSETWYDYCELSAYEYMLKESTKELDCKNKKIKELENQVKMLTPQFVPRDSEGNPLDDDDNYDDVDTDYPVSYCLTGFLESIRAVMNSYKIFYPNPNEVRIVMWFDN